MKSRKVRGPLLAMLAAILRASSVGAVDGVSRGKSRDALRLYEDGQSDAARAVVVGRRGLRSKVIHAAISAREAYPEALSLYAEGRLRVEGRRVRILPS